MTHRTARPAGLAAIALSIGLTLTACSDDTPDEAPTDTSSATADASGSPADGGTDGASEEPTDDAEGIGDPTTTALAAVATAEAETGGVAFAIDADDAATSWQVDVAADGGTVEVTVDEAGTEVLSTTSDDLDAADGDALDGANVGLAEAIQRVVGQSGGTVEEADLETGDGAARWNVSVRTQDDTDEDHLVDLADGSVTQGD